MDGLLRSSAFSPFYDGLGSPSLSAVLRKWVDGLSSYVYGGSREEALAVARRLRTGMVHLNGADNDVKLPFGGYKQSGNGREWGKAGLEDYLETKAVMAA